ncbi:hypothetical protein [Natroniella sp. ANB-PHB2]|uniref:hypothetical protein n=1 Tax=Natroniella sp. ANB-PHB2 TaxID=3384444 RepID=UPI0038D4DFE4
MAKEEQKQNDKVQQEEEFADISAFKVPRDEEGNLLPEMTTTKYGKVKVVPLTYGTIEQYKEEIEDLKKMGSDVVAELCQRFKVPDMSDFTEEDVEDMRPMAVQEILFALFGVSDVKLKRLKVNQDHSVDIELDEKAEENQEKDDIKN